jgi:ADP-ribose pyrophosphatase YjhB (NUDIX family)
VPPGYGQRHPDVAALLAGTTPAITADVRWLQGTLPLRVSAYPEVADLPGDMVTSVRCIVIVGDRIVVCDNADGCHPWPGGRREMGETYVETACREVHEETGWRLEPHSLELLGWLHLENLTVQAPDHPFPHPDFLQVVYVGHANRRDGTQGGDWTDTEGWEVSSTLATLDDAIARMDSEPVAVPFLELLRNRT